MIINSLLIMNSKIKNNASFSKLQSPLHIKTLDFLTLEDISICVKVCRAIRNSITEWGIIKTYETFVKIINAKKYPIKKLLEKNGSQVLKEANIKLVNPLDWLRMISYLLLSANCPPKKNEEKAKKSRSYLDIEINCKNEMNGKFFVDILPMMFCHSIHVILLDLENNHLTDQFLIKNNNISNTSLLKSFKYLNNLQELNLKNNKIGDISAKNLFVYLIHSKCPLNKLDLSYNNISFESGKELCNLMIGLKKLKYLDISFNILGSIGIALISPGLQANGSINTLNLGHNGIGEEGCKYLIHSLEYNQSLKFLGLGGNCIVENGYKYINEILKKIEIEEIDLHYNGCKGKGLNNMASFLEVNKSLKKIDLSGNNIKFDSSIDFFQGLNANSSITSMILKDNNLDYKTIYAILNESMKCTSLSFIDLSYNNFNEQSCKAMYEYLKFNKNIKDIDLSHCNIGKGLKFVAEGLKVNTSLKSIKLNYNDFPAQSIKHLISSLYMNLTLMTLSLEGNNIDDSSALDLAKFFIGAKTMITSVDLSNNKVGMKGKNHLLEAIKITPMLSHINLEKNQIG